MNTMLEVQILNKIFKFAPPTSCSFMKKKVSDDEVLL